MNGLLWVTTITPIGPDPLGPVIMIVQTPEAVAYNPYDSRDEARAKLIDMEQLAHDAAYPQATGA